VADIYLVWSNEATAWWGPNGGRYTADIWSAGRYDETEARKACDMRTWSLGKPPPEVMVRAPEADQPTFTADDLRAMPNLMWKRVEDATREAMAQREADRAR
jgi:hypothetical protein